MKVTVEFTDEVGGPEPEADAQDMFEASLRLTLKGEPFESSTVSLYLDGELRDQLAPEER